MSAPSVASKSWKVVRYHASSYTDGNAKLDRSWKQQQLPPPPSSSSPSSIPTAAPISPLVACYNGGNVTLLDLTTGHIARTIHAEADDEFVTFTLSPSHHLLATLSRRTSQLTLHPTATTATTATPQPTVSIRLNAYHSLPISVLAFDPSSRYIVSASHDRTLRIFDLHHTPNPQLVHTLRGHQQPILSAVFHPIGKRLQLVSGDSSGVLRVWSLATGECQVLSTEHMAAITTITFTAATGSGGKGSGGHMITAGRDKVICVWDVSQSYKCIRTITAFETIDSLLPWPHSAPVPHSPSKEADSKAVAGKRPAVVFVSGGEKGQMRWWDGETGKELYHYALPTLLNTATTAAAADSTTTPSAADKYIANQIAHLLLLPLPAAVTPTTSESPAVTTTAGSTATPFHVIAVTREQNFHVFTSLPSISPVTLYVGHNDEIIDLRFLPSSTTSAATAADTDSSTAVGTAAATYAVVVTNSPQPRVFNLETLSATLLSGHSDIVLAVDVSADGRFISTASKDRTVRVWSTANATAGGAGGWRCMAVCEGHTESVGAVGVSKSVKGSAGRLFVVSGARDRTIKLWDATALNTLTTDDQDGQDDVLQLPCTSTRVAHEKDINCIAISPNDKLIASGSEDRTIHLFSTTPPTPTTATATAASTAATAAHSLTSVAVLKGHRRGVWSLRFSPVDRVLASASGDKTIRIWSLVDFTCVKVLEGHNGSVKSVAWLRGGLHIVSGGDDGLMKCWLVKTSECVGTWTVPVHESGGEVTAEESLDDDETVGEKVWALNVSSDGRQLITGGVSSVLNVWQDVTDEQAELRRTEQSLQLNREQRLSNAIRRRHWKEALDIALSLKQPRRLHYVLNELVKEGVGGVMKVGELVCGLDDERLDVLLTYVRDWNTNSKTAMIANVVLQVLFKHYPMSVLQKKKLLVDSLPGMVIYCERHFQRIDRLLQRSYLIDYTLDAMNLLLPEDERESDELLDEPVAIKHEPLFLKDAQTRQPEPMDEEKEAADDDEDVDEDDVLVSLSQPSAPGGPARSRILALDKLAELEADHEEVNEADGADVDSDGEWQSSWASPAAATSAGKRKVASTAAQQETVIAPVRRKKAPLEHKHTETRGHDDEGDEQTSQAVNSEESKQPTRTPSKRAVTDKQRTNTSSSKRSGAVASDAKKRKKSK